MRKLLNNPWFVGAMALVALGVVVNSVWPSKPRYAQAAADAADGAVTETGSTDTGDAHSLSIPDALKALAVSSPVRDPFAGTAVAEKTGAAEKVELPDAVDTVHLSAVWIQQGNNLALINDRIVAAGEEIGRLKIESASSEGVWVTHWKGRNFISVGGDFSLSTPATQPLTSTSSL